MDALYMDPVEVKQPPLTTTGVTAREKFNVKPNL